MRNERGEGAVVAINYYLWSWWFYIICDHDDYIIICDHVITFVTSLWAVVTWGALSRVHVTNSVQLFFGHFTFWLQTGRIYDTNHFSIQIHKKGVTVSWRSRQRYKWDRYFFRNTSVFILNDAVQDTIRVRLSCSPRYKTRQSDDTIITATPTTRIQLVFFQIEEFRAGSRGRICTRLRLVQIHTARTGTQNLDFKIQALCSSWSAVIYSIMYIFISYYITIMLKL